MLYKDKIVVITGGAHDDTHMLNASELCTILDQEYGISTDRRTIYTEMEILEKFGLDIQQKKGKNPGYYIGARDFELPELKLLVDAVQCSSDLDCSVKR